MRNIPSQLKLKFGLLFYFAATSGDFAGFLLIKTAILHGFTAL